MFRNAAFHVIAVVAALCSVLTPPISAASDEEALPGSREYRRQAIERLVADLERRIHSGESDAAPDLAQRILDLEAIDDPRNGEISDAEHRVYRLLEQALGELNRVGEAELATVQRLASEIESISQGATEVRVAAMEASDAMPKLGEMHAECSGGRERNAKALEDARRFIDSLQRHPVSAYLEPEAHRRIEAAVARVRAATDRACSTSDPHLSADALREAERAAEPVRACESGVLSWRVQQRRDHGDVIARGASLGEFAELYISIERQLEAVADGFMQIPADRPQRLLDDATRIWDRLQPHQRRLESAASAYARALEVLGRGGEPHPTWAASVKVSKVGATIDVKTLRDAQRVLADARSSVTELRQCLAALRGPQGLEPVQQFLEKADALGPLSDRWTAEVRRQLERGRACFDALAMADPTGASPTPTPEAPKPPPAGAAPPAAPDNTGNGASGATGAPVTSATTAADSSQHSVNPDVSGGLVIRGPARIPVGGTGAYRTTDHGGRPVGGASWHALSDIIRVGSDGVVEGLRPGRATIMATVNGMRAYLEIEVVEAVDAPSPTPAPTATPVPPLTATPGVTPPPGLPPTATPVITPTPTSGVTPIPTTSPFEDDRTTDWAEDRPTTSWISEPEDEEPPGAQPADKGGFADFGTDVKPASTEPTNTNTDRGPADEPAALGAEAPGGGFADEGLEVIKGDTEPDEPARRPAPTDTTEPAGEPSDEAEPSSEMETLKFMGVDVGQAPEAAAPPGGGAIPLLPPPGESDAPTTDRQSPTPNRSPFSPDDDNRPFVPQRASVAGGTQPAAYHIFATCSRLGWAGGLATYSVGPADAAIAEHLLLAGEHAMWANRTSYPPTPAWPGWQGRRGLWGQWASRLARTRDPVFRGQLATSLRDIYKPLSAALDVQTRRWTHHTETCDAEYCRLGFLMAWGQQALAVAEEARLNGDLELADRAARDGRDHLRLARQRLSVYQRIAPATGICADLSTLPALLDAAINGGAAQARYAWETALRAVMALAPGQPPANDNSLLGGWALADGRVVTVTQRGESLVGTVDGRELFRMRPRGGDGVYDGSGLLTTRSGGSSSSRWYDGMTITVQGNTARGVLGQFGFIMTRAGDSRMPPPAPQTASAPATSLTKCPIVHFDGNIEGQWRNRLAEGIRYVRAGDEWHGSYTSMTGGTRDDGYKIGETFIRLRRTGRLTYSGTCFYKDYGSTGRYNPKTETWEVIVAGRYLFVKGSSGYRAIQTRNPMPHGFSDSWEDFQGAVGCRPSGANSLECTVELSSWDFSELSETRLQAGGYSLIVFRPASRYASTELAHWVLEHHGEPLCADQLPGVSPGPSSPSTSHRQSPSGEPRNMEMMGTRDPDQP